MALATSHDPEILSKLVSPQRFASYVSAAGGDAKKAVELYRWNVSLSAACFEAFHYVEIIVRNAIDREMAALFNENTRLIPWFLLPVVDKNVSVFEESVGKVRKRLRDQGTNRETRDQVIAGLDFGFWPVLLHSENEELWRKALHRAFPHSSGKRKDVVAVLEVLRIFRNKLAHHDSLLNVDVPFRLSQMHDVLGWIDPKASEFLAEVEHVSEIYALRPSPRKDTVVVAARDAWRLYQNVGVYVCQAGRTFQPVDYLAFYADKEIKTEVPKILRRRDNVDWTSAEVGRLLSSPDDEDRDLADIISKCRALGWTEGRYQLFELTQPGEADHVTLPKPVEHHSSGKGSAFTQRQRYVVCHKLKSATNTAELS